MCFFQLNSYVIYFFFFAFIYVYVKQICVLAGKWYIKGNSIGGVFDNIHVTILRDSIIQKGLVNKVEVMSKVADYVNFDNDADQR